MNRSVPLRTVAGVGLVAYSIFLLVVLLAPSSGQQSAAVAHVADWLTDLGAPERYLTASRAEFYCNALILVPAAALGSVLWPAASWRQATAYTFVGACLVEMTQGLLLPHRTPSTADVVANTLGALIGVVLVKVVHWLLRAL